MAGGLLIFLPFALGTGPILFLNKMGITHVSAGGFLEMVATLNEFFHVDDVFVCFVICCACCSSY